MTFEPLSYSHTFQFEDFPVGWLPLIHLYDPDIPLFPTFYFHILSGGLSPAGRVNEKRVYGFVDGIHRAGQGVEVSILCNRDLSLQENAPLRSAVREEIRERLGVQNPVTLEDISVVFLPPLEGLNSFLVALWNRIVPRFLGNALPFGRFYDEVFGLVRMVSTFFPPAGRKSELIQTHYFLSKFGKRIQITEEASKAIFFLLPTYGELTGTVESINLFPEFKTLCDAVDHFCEAFSSTRKLDDLQFSEFKPSKAINTQEFLNVIETLSPISQESIIQCFNAFDKGPRRTVLFLLMLKDLKDRKIPYRHLTPKHFHLIYEGLERTYQSPKVLNLYAQQCFGNPSAFPIDTWIESLVEWALWIYPLKRRLDVLFEYSRNLGKAERLLWLAAQSRKVHSPLCDDVLWCTKINSTKNPRGANPLSCCACSSSIRNSCLGFNKIADMIVRFNTPGDINTFRIETSKHDNLQPNQRFIRCEGFIDGRAVHDDFTSVDVPEIFHPFPKHPPGEALTVREFIAIYRR